MKNTVSQNLLGKGALSFLAGIFLLAANAHAAGSAVTGLYVGGDFYPPITKSTLAKASGFNTLFLFTLHVYTNGDIYFNDTPVAQNGVYVGTNNWGTSLAALKPAIRRTELVIGAWGDPSFDNIKTLIASQGTGVNSILYKNFLALKNATGVDAIQYDDEQTYDVPSSVTFGNMIVGMGMKVTLCPYTTQSYWKSVKSQLGTNVDAIYLQCYDGGAGNDPGSWNNAFGGFKVYPGLWGNTSDCPTVTTRMRQWQETLGITGGFMWLNGGMPSDPLKWGQALFFGLNPLNGLIAEDSATNYSATGFTGNQGFGFGPWTMSTTGGGAYISGNSPSLFGIWNSAAHGQSTASRTLNAPLLPGQSFSVQLQMTSLDHSTDLNAFELQDTNGAIVFRYWHQGGDNANGHYADASVTNGTAAGFAYDFNKADAFTFTLKSPTTYTFTDNTTGASTNGTLSGGAISQVTFRRQNGTPAPSSGDDFKFNSLIVFVPQRTTLTLQPAAQGWTLSFPATPLLTYHLQRATQITGPWNTIGTATPLFNSSEINDTSAPAGSALYRIVTP